MSIRVAVTSSDGRTVDQHFGHCSAFCIAEIGGDGIWKITEVRRTEQTCHAFSHDETHVQEVVELLSDCRDVPAPAAFRSREPAARGS